MKFVATVFLVAIAVATIHTILSMSNYRSLAVRDIKEKMVEICKITAINLSASLEFEDHDAAYEIIESLKTLPDLEQIAIYDDEGKVFARYSKNESANVIAKPAWSDGKDSLIEEGDGKLIFYQKISSNSEFLGTLALKASLDRVQAVLNRNRWMNISIMGIYALCTALAAYFISNAIIEPIMRLRDFAKKLASGDFTERMEVTSDDELGELTSAINIMATDMNLALQNVVDASMKVAESSSRLSVTSQHVTTTTEEISVNTRQITENSIEAAQRSKRAMESAERGHSIVKKAVNGMVKNAWTQAQENAQNTRMKKPVLLTHCASGNLKP